MSLLIISNLSTDENREIVKDIWQKNTHYACAEMQAFNEMAMEYMSSHPMLVSIPSSSIKKTTPNKLIPILEQNKNINLLILTNNKRINSFENKLYEILNTRFNSTVFYVYNKEKIDYQEMLKEVLINLKRT